MKMVLRIASVLLLLWVAFTAAGVAQLMRMDGFLGKLIATGGLGYVTLLGWGLVFTVGVPAAVQLWRLRISGLVGAWVLCGYALAYNALGLTLFRGPRTLIIPLAINVVVAGVALALLTSRPARRRCANGTNQSVLEPTKEF